MSTISNFDDALDFMPSAKPKSPRRTLFATLRIVVEAMREGFRAAHQYQELTARGVNHAEAANRVFGEHFTAR